MKLYKEQCKIDARYQFFSNHVVDNGTLYLQQSSLAPVWLFLNEI